MEIEIGLILQETIITAVSIFGGSLILYGVFRG